MRPRHPIVFWAALLASFCGAVRGSGGCPFFKGEVRTPAAVAVVNSGEELKAYLRSGGGDGEVVKLNVLNGTYWIHLGGKVGDFDVVLGSPPSSSSDMSLQEALSLIGNSSKAQVQKVVINYFESGIEGDVIDVSNAYGKTLHIWTRKSQPADVAANVRSVVKLPSGSYALDVVFRRVEVEDVLLPFDFYRMKKIIADIFSGKRIDQAETIYVKRKHRTIERKHMNSFTELFVSNLARLVSESNARYNSGQSETRRISFMPDLQNHEVAYEEAAIDEVREQLRKSPNCSLLEARAGVFSQEESVRRVGALLDEFPTTQLYLRVEPYDRVDEAKLRSAMLTIGLERIITEFPDNQPFSLSPGAKASAGRASPEKEGHKSSVSSAVAVTSTHLALIAVLAMRL